MTQTLSLSTLYYNMQIICYMELTVVQDMALFVGFNPQSFVLLGKSNNKC